MVDPDGIHANEKPFSVYCSFPDNVTIIGEDVEGPKSRAGEKGHESENKMFLPNVITQDQSKADSCRRYHHKTHSNVKEGDTPFKCPQCEKSFDCL